MQVEVFHNVCFQSTSLNVLWNLVCFRCHQQGACLLYAAQRAIVFPKAGRKSSTFISEFRGLSSFLPHVSESWSVPLMFFNLLLLLALDLDSVHSFLNFEVRLF